MTAVTDSDLKRLEELILNGQKAMESRFTAVENSLEELKTDVKALDVGQKALEAGQAEIVKSVEINRAEIKGEIKTLEAGIKGEIKTLEAKIDGFNKRSKSIDKIPDLAEKIGELKNWRSIAILILGAVVGWVTKNSLGNNP